MKKSSLIVVVFGVLVAGSLVFAINNKKASAPESSKSSLVSENTESNSSGGKYVEYSEAELANAEGQRVLFFHAPWCPQCRSIEKGINAETIPEKVTILKVDYDSNQDLRKKYGVTIQTTFVKIDDSGNLTGKYVAYDEPTFDSVKKNFL